MEQSTAPADQSSYTTAGRHRREIGPGRIRLTVAHAGAWPGAEGPTVLVNGFAFAVGRGETVIQVPAGPMLVEVHRPWLRQDRPARIEFVLDEGSTVDLRLSELRLRIGAARLHVTGVGAPAA